MQGLGQVNMKGKLHRDMDCKCCTFYNFKKLDVYNDNYSHKKEAAAYLGDGSNNYPQLQKLFKGYDLKIEIDHPVGEDVIYLDGKFNGYVSHWMDLLSWAEALKIEYSNHEEIEEKLYADGRFSFKYVA